MIELKKCPFCGSKAEIIVDKAFNAETGEGVSEPMCFVWCTECSALVSGATKNDAIREWNRRANNDSD